MLVLLGPPFEGTDAEYARLAQVTGLVAYELKTRIRPGSWGVVRALADEAQARQLGQAILSQGFRVAVVDPQLIYEPSRRTAILHGLRLEPEQLVLDLSERTIAVPYAALLVIVRGEVQTGARPIQARSTRSSATFRAVVPSASDIAVFRESMPSGDFDAYAAADLHFVTVPWIARVDARAFPFQTLGLASDNPVQALDQLADALAERAGIRVDRSSRVSSVASFSTPGPARTASPVPGGPAASRPVREGDERFEGYSRLIGEAERQTKG
jgi:hypothetical protein